MLPPTAIAPKKTYNCNPNGYGALALRSLIVLDDDPVVNRKEIINLIVIRRREGFLLFQH